MIKNLFITSFITLSSALNVLNSTSIDNIDNTNIVPKANDSLVCVGESSYVNTYMFNDLASLRLSFKYGALSYLSVDETETTFNLGYSFDLIYFDSDNGYYIDVPSHGATTFSFYPDEITYYLDGEEHPFYYDVGAVLYVSFHAYESRPYILNKTLLNFYLEQSLYFNFDNFYYKDYFRFFINPYIKLPKTLEHFENYSDFLLSNSYYDDFFAYPYDYQSSNSINFNGMVYTIGSDLTFINTEYTDLSYQCRQLQSDNYYLFTLLRGTTKGDYVIDKIPIIETYTITFNMLYFLEYNCTYIDDYLSGNYYFNWDNTPNINSQPSSDRLFHVDVDFTAGGTSFNAIEIEIDVSSTGVGYRFILRYLNDFTSVVVLNFIISVDVDGSIGSGSIVKTYYTERDELRLITLDSPYYDSNLSTLLVNYYNIDGYNFMPSIPGDNNYLINVFTLFSLAFSGLASFLNISIFPLITIGSLILIPLVLGVIMFIIKLFKR